MKLLISKLKKFFVYQIYYNYIVIIIIKLFRRREFYFLVTQSYLRYLISTLDISECAELLNGNILSHLQ